MSSGQGWFESDEDYRDRVAREADERTIENSTGDAPSQGWFESDESYRERISQEANEHRVEDSTGSAPSQGWFESDSDYRDRIAQEANERTIEASTGTAPKQGWFESDDDYDIRIRKEANEHIIEDDSGSAPKQGWFEGDHDYRSRIAHEARESRARDRSGSTSDGGSSSASDNDSDSGSYSGGGSTYGAGTESGSGAGVLVFFGLLVVGAIVAFNNFSTPPTSSPPSSQPHSPPAPAGFTVPPSTVSPNRYYGVLAPSFERYQQGGTQNAIIEMQTGRVVATIAAETEFADPNIRGHGGHSEMRPHWSSDSSLLLWEVSGKWFPTALVLIRIEDGVSRWQVDLLKVAQQEMLVRTRKANPQQYAAAKKANAGNGSAYPDGFTIDVSAGATGGLRLPLPVRARLTSNPKQIDGIPTVEAQLDGMLDSNGAVTFTRYHFGPAR